MARYNMKARKYTSERWFGSTAYKHQCWPLVFLHSHSSPMPLAFKIITVSEMRHWAKMVDVFLLPSQQMAKVPSRC